MLHVHLRGSGGRPELIQLVSLADAVPFDHNVEEAVEHLRPGRCFSCFGPKVDYIRQNGRGDQVYIEAIEHFNINFFKWISSTTAPEFESLFQVVLKYIIPPIDPKIIRPKKEDLRVPRNQTLMKHIMLFFIYMCFLVGSK